MPGSVASRGKEDDVEVVLVAPHRIFFLTNPKKQISFPFVKICVRYICTLLNCFFGSLGFVLFAFILGD